MERLYTIVVDERETWLDVTEEELAKVRESGRSVRVLASGLFPKYPE